MIALRVVGERPIDANTLFEREIERELEQSATHPGRFTLNLKRNQTGRTIFLLQWFSGSMLIRRGSII